MGPGGNRQEGHTEPKTSQREIVMHRNPSRPTRRTVLTAAGICLFGLCGQSASGGEFRAVIIDPAWTIEIRPGQQQHAVPAPDPSTGTARPTIIPAVYQAAGPTPEGKETKSIGPELPPAVAPVAAPVQGPVPVVTPRMTYAQAYVAVPFSRTEYEANPVYRHQAALELMFGVLRPMTLNQQYMPRAFRYPDFYQYPYAHSGTQNIDIHQWGGGYNHGGFNGQSPFGYPYGLRGNW